MSLYEASIAISVCDNFVPTIVGPHKAAPAPPPAVVPVGIVPHVESPMMMMGPMWFAFGKFTTTVTHLGLTIVLDGHDVGWMIPHVCIPPNNALTALIIVFSTRTTNFAAMTVQANKKPIATAQLFLIPQPMMVCHEPISLPSGMSVFGSLQNVKLGMTLLDLVLGLITIAVSIVIDLFLNGGGAKAGEAERAGIGSFSAGWRNTAKNAQKGVIDGVGPSFRSFLGQRGLLSLFNKKALGLFGTGLRETFRHSDFQKNILKKLIWGELTRENLRRGLVRTAIKGAKNIPTETARIVAGYEGSPVIKIGGSGNAGNIKIGVKHTPDGHTSVVLKGSIAKTTATESDMTTWPSRLHQRYQEGQARQEQRRLDAQRQLEIARFGQPLAYPGQTFISQGRPR